MEAVNALREQLPEYARDLKINLQTVMTQSSLSAAQCWGVALACAIAVGEPRLLAAVSQDAAAQSSAEVVDDARAAATLMGMNNVFYRFRHLMGKPVYEQLPARLRMQRIAKPATNKADFELFCLAVSAVNNCQTCLQSHEAVVLEGGLSEQNIFDAVRIAATVAGVGAALRGAPAQ
jgi:alkyl hydroperoxide reductase subunit D